MPDTPDDALRPALREPRRFTRGALAALIAISATGTCVLETAAPAVISAESFRAVDLVATQAAITMNGTFTPDVTPQFQAAVLDAYIGPLVGPGYTGVPLRTPQDLWPLSGITALTYNDSTRVGYEILTDKYDDIVGQNAADGQPTTPMVVFGYSQSAFIASMFDERLAQIRELGGTVPPTTFVQVGNTNIPNGGLMSRFNGLGLTPWTELVFAPTKTGNTTYEVFRQYDPFADFPKYVLNPLAVVNSLVGYLLHFTLPVSGSAPWLAPVINLLNLLITPISLNPASPNYVQPIVSRYEDTVYQFVPTDQLPLLSPLYALGLTRFADALDPVFRPLIEAGYDRSVSFGEPTPAVFGLGPNFAPALKESWQALRQLLSPGPSVPTASAATQLPPPASAQPVAGSVADAQGAQNVLQALPVSDAPTADPPGAAGNPAATAQPASGPDPATQDQTPVAAGDDASAVFADPGAADDSGRTGAGKQPRRSAAAATGSEAGPAGAPAAKGRYAGR
ncbi:MAG: PE-PPE domain-containing protein [Mycobacterium sp.]|nr:PE-PPE domain-containing protein [Mycobacterium sp.]